MVSAMNVVNFTPVQGLAGGLVVGTVAAATLLMNGRVLGLSGVLR